MDIWVHTHSRLYDPANPRDRRTLLEDAVDSEYESGKTSSRVRRDVAANAREGRPHGRCPYGFRRVFNPRTGRLENWEPDPQTAPHIEELFRRKNAGTPLREVARDWARRGIRGGSGKSFTDKDLRSMLGRPCYAGLRAHVPGSRGGGSRVVAESQLFPATWEAIVSVEEWRKAQRVVVDGEGRKARPGKARYLLSHIGRCGVCGGRLAGVTGSGAPKYGCHAQGCIRVAMDDLDAYAEALLLAYLSDTDVVAEIRGRDGAEGEELTAARAEVARLKRLNEELAEAVSAEQISVTLAGTSERKNNAKITELGALVKSLTVASPLLELIEPGADLRERWTLTPIGARREIMRDVFSPSRLGELRVQRVPASAPRGPRRYPVRERVALWQAEAS